MGSGSSGRPQPRVPLDWQLQHGGNSCRHLSLLRPDRHPISSPAPEEIHRHLSRVQHHTGVSIWLRNGLRSPGDALSPAPRIGSRRPRHVVPWSGCREKGQRLCQSQLSRALMFRICFDLSLKQVRSTDCLKRTIRNMWPSS